MLGVMLPDHWVGPLGVYLWPWPQPAIVVVPPPRAVAPLFWTAVPTLLSWTFSRMTLPAVAGDELVVQAVLIATGVLVMTESMSVMLPTVCCELPPAVISIPVWQLLIERPEYV